MRKKRIMLFMAAIMLVSVIGIFAAGSSVEAKTKNVTSKYKKSVQKTLRAHDEYLGYGCDNKIAFKFDNYARSTMLCFAKGEYWGKSLKQLKAEYKRQWKKTFTAKFAFKMKKHKGDRWAGTPRPWSNPSYLIQLVDGKAEYLGGDWGDVGPRGYVKKIQQNGKSYVVTYQIKWFDYVENKSTGTMGSYKITLKKSGSRWKIRNIKRLSAKAGV